MKLWNFRYFADHWDWTMTYIRRKTHWFDPARQRIDGCFLHDWSRDMIKKHGANWTPQNSHGCWLNHFNSDDCYLNHHRLVGRIVWNHWYVGVSWMNVGTWKKSLLIFQVSWWNQWFGVPPCWEPSRLAWFHTRPLGRPPRQTLNGELNVLVGNVCCLLQKKLQFRLVWRNPCHSDLVWWCKKTKREWQWMGDDFDPISQDWLTNLGMVLLPNVATSRL